MMIILISNYYKRRDSIKTSLIIKLIGLAIKEMSLLSTGNNIQNIVDD